jgi:sugar phosphate isomerase/epimerase
MEIRLCAFADEAGKLLSEQISALKRNKIYLIEIRSVDGINIKYIKLGRAAQIADKLKEEGLEVWSIGSPLGKVKITDDFNEEKERLRHILELCKIFHCNKIRVFSFFTKDYDKYRNEVFARLQEMVDISGQDNVLLYHENEKEIYGDNAKRVKDLLENVKGMQSIYDPANYIQIGEDTDTAIKEVLPYAGYLHIK